MGQDVGVVIRRQQGIDRHRHYAGVQCAQEHHGPVGRVLHQQQDALFAAQPQLAQGARHAGHPLRQFAIAQLARVVDVGGFGRARRVQRGQVTGEIQFGGAGIHGCLLMSWWWGRAMAVFFLWPGRGRGPSWRAA
ncbi:hypothetical protein G6F31_019403 [Rhizopus arrhizus]|nr:hypothetical protein G6F31_019403 [Rhizopus arrhizus]